MVQTVHQRGARGEKGATSATSAIRTPDQG